MAHDKPKVTIDLDEYLELKKKAAQAADPRGARVIIRVGDNVGFLPNADFGSANAMKYFVREVHNGENASCRLVGVGGMGGATLYVEKVKTP